ncbi:MAG: exodeoxyribonuclease V subunit alpha [Candidatus Cloacimonetes bacterium]|nr:exodeoxyribonuclease V subunit alpha [Candidatus Cloacimonadota bacterium]
MISKSFIQQQLATNEIELNFEAIQLICDLSSDFDESVELSNFLIFMFQSLNNGSVCLTLSKNHQFESDVDWVTSFLQKLNDFESLIHEGYSQHHPILFEVLENGSHRFFFHKYFMDRNETRDLLVNLANKNLSSTCNTQEIIDQLYQEDYALRISKNGLLLARDPWQLQAIEKSLTNDFLIISGGPGTGKTSLMVNILRGLTQLGLKDIHLIAPTGRASQRMTEALRVNLSTISNPSADDLYLFNEIEGKTIHRLLKMRGDGDFFYNAKRRLKSQVIVVDEVSMIDADLMSALLSSLDLNQTKLIFLGDKNQLPSVQAGAVFSDLLSMKELSTSLIELRTSYRSKQVIQKFAKSINSKGYTCEDSFLNEIPALGDDHYYFLNDQKNDTRESILKSWLKLSYLSSQWTDLLVKDDHESTLMQAFDQAKQFQILTASRRGKLGCENLNQWCIQQLQPKLSQGPLFHGAVILVKTNDYQKKLFNGDTGIVWQSKTGAIRVYFQRGDQIISFSRSELPLWEYGFCMTVHKAQGCEFDHVLFVISNAPSDKIYNKQLVYTAITRAKKSVGVLSNQKLFEKAVKTAVHRESSF